MSKLSTDICHVICRYLSLVSIAETK